MKCSSMMAIAFCGVFAVAVTGCRYDDDALGAGEDAAVAQEVATESDATAGASDVATDADADAAKNAAAAAADADSSSLDAALGSVPFDQDPNYARCTDVDFAPVYFGFDASNLAAGEMSKIEAVAEHLQAKANRVVIIEGNCDERGSNEYNLSLGDLRATSIRKYLESLGIEPNRIQTKSYGEEKPAVVGQGEAVWSKNRRGEFAIFQHK